ncbi:MAG: hypothetical protein WCF23_03365 [Candidatus Nitrosopolaris sp.]
MNSVNKVIWIILPLTLVSANGGPHAYAHHSSYNPDPGQNNVENQGAQSFQQTCFSYACAAGWTDGEKHATVDWEKGNQIPHQERPTDQPHSHDYCSQYWLGYGDEWNRSTQRNLNTNQEQGASVNIKGNNNKVNIEQG